MGRDDIKAVWRTDDGRIFDEVEDAEDYVKRRAVVDWILLNLSSNPDAEAWARRIEAKFRSAL